MEKTEFYNAISPYVPDRSIDLIYNIFNKYSLLLVISKPRISKLGDFRPLNNRKEYRISVNGDLNEYEFLITLFHELSHLIVWDEYNKRVKPHGKEWKQVFSTLIQTLLAAKVFPEDVNYILSGEIKNGRLNFSNMNSSLARVLEAYSSDKKYLRLEDIPDKAVFTLQSGKIMVKGQKLRKRYKCREVNSARLYYVHKLAKIIRFTEQ